MVRCTVASRAPPAESGPLAGRQGSGSGGWVREGMQGEWGDTPTSQNSFKAGRRTRGGGGPEARGAGGAEKGGDKVEEGVRG